MTKEEYVNKIISLSSMLCKKPDDYTKEKVKENNKAAQKLTVLEKELYKNRDLTDKVLEELLENEDSFIKSNAAVDCLNLNLHVKKALKVLEHLSKKGEPWEAMGAKRQLKIWRGEIGPDDPG